MSPPIADVFAELESNCQLIAADLARQGWCLCPDFLDTQTVSAIRGQAQSQWDSGQYRHAGIGRGDDFVIKPEIRNDRVMWLNPSVEDTPLGRYFRAQEALRQILNRHLYLGLCDYEAHFAVYPAGSFYKKHLDQFRGIGLRTVTTTFYLNQNWQSQDGGQLRLYHNPQDSSDFLDIFPEAGRLVCFLSADFQHEVLPAARERFSITGWFRQRPV